jgi:hypothetical protein
MKIHRVQLLLLKYLSNALFLLHLTQRFEAQLGQDFSTDRNTFL